MVDRITFPIRVAAERPGPASWELGRYPEGQSDHPVGGLNWYEASAYCRSVGKSLPSVHHWLNATAQDQFGDIMRVSNYESEGPAPVGSLPGLGDRHQSSTHTCSLTADASMLRCEIVSRMTRP